MAIGALIKHITKDRVDSKVLLPHIIEIRALAVRQPGYISGETFFHLDRPEECLVMSKWTSLELWHRWTRDPRRIELHQNIKEHLGAETECNIYGVGLW